MAPPAIDEAALIDSLDDEWRSPTQIRTRLGLQQIWSIASLPRWSDSPIGVKSIEGCGTLMCESTMAAI
jgi:hypothetical protein